MYRIYVAALSLLLISSALGQTNPPTQPSSNKFESHITHSSQSKIENKNGSSNQISPAAPVVQSSKYGDWMLRCVLQGTTSPKFHACEVLQAISLSRQVSPIALIAVGRPQPTEPLYVTVRFPNNVAFSSKASIALDDKNMQTLELNWTRCAPAGCFARVVLRDDILKQWRERAQPGKLEFVNSFGKNMTLSMSFQGLAQALDALAKEY